MAKRVTRRNSVADKLLYLFHFRKAAVLLAWPYAVAVDIDFKSAAGCVGGKNDRTDFLGKGGEKLLRHPARPQSPAAQSTIHNLDHSAGIDAILS
jgi:hypothetical protein